MIERQNGFTMLMVLPMMAIMGVIMVQGYVQLQKSMERDRARTIGNRTVMVNNAIRALLAQEGPTLTTGTRTGVNWLKPAGCGGTASQRYLDCSLMEPLPYGLTFRTEITQHGAWVEAVTTLGPILAVDGSSRDELAGLAVLTANGGHVSTQQPVTSTFYAYQLLPGGVIEARASTASSLDAWLRTDGSNQMNAALNMGGNNINNAAIVEATTSVITPVVIDTDNPAFTVKPSGTSTMQNIVVANDIYLASLGRYLSEAVLYQTIAGYGDRIQKPACPNGIPFPTLAIERVNENGIANPLASLEPWLIDASPTEWEVRFRIMTQSGYVNVYAPWARVQVSVKCQV